MEWINIQDKQPDKFSEIIICTNEGRVKSAIYMGNGKFNTFVPVAYWMPFPEPPKPTKTSEDKKEEMPVEPVKKKRGRPKKS
jgi:hypothetical protein